MLQARVKNLVFVAYTLALFSFFAQSFGMSNSGFLEEVYLGKHPREDNQESAVSKRPRLVLQLPHLRTQPATAFNYQRLREIGERPVAERMRNTLINRMQENQRVVPLNELTQENLARWARTQRLDLVDTLRITMPFDRNESISVTPAHILLIARYFPGITALEFDVSFTMDPAAFQALAESALARQLIRLKFMLNNHAGQASSSFITEQFNRFSSLRSLYFAYDEDLQNVAFAALALSACAGNLRSLQIGENGINEEGLTYRLLNYFRSLEELRLWGNLLGNTGFAILATSIVARQLRVLDVSQNSLTRRALNVNYLNNFERLEELYIHSNEIGDNGFTALAKSRLAQMLRVLDVRHTEITEASFTLENLNRFKKLIKLNIWANQIKDAGFKALALSTIASTLRILNCGNNDITGLVFTPEYLNKFVKLEVLKVANNMLGSSAAESIAKSTLAKQLRVLNLGNNRTDPYTFEELELNLPVPTA